MAESPDQTALQRRATWVGLKTLRQRPKMVGRTRSGEPVFEVRSVRLVLRADAGHFSRLAECSKCGREVPGPPVLGPADLDRPAHSVICKDCVRASVAASPLQPERRQVRPETANTPAAEPESEPSKPVEPADDVRLAAMEAELQSAMSRLAELADVQDEELAESRLQEALRKGLADIRAEVLEASEGSTARADLEALAQVVQAQQRQLVSLSAELDETRADVQRLAGVQRDETAESRLQEGLADIRAEVLRSSESGPAWEDVEALAQLVQGQQGQVVSLSAVLDETRAEVKRLAESDLESRTAPAGAGIAGLEERLRGDVATLVQLVETLRGDIEGPLGTSAQNGMAMVVRAIQELAQGRDEVKARLDALASAIEEGGGRVQELELRIEKSIDGLSAALDDYRRELRLSATTNGRLDRAGEPAASGTPTPGELLDGLERQLQEAESRLARLTGGPDGGVRPPGDG